jgi:hypothetical protein
LALNDDGCVAVVKAEKQRGTSSIDIYTAGQKAALGLQKYYPDFLVGGEDFATYDTAWIVTKYMPSGTASTS